MQLTHALIIVALTGDLQAKDCNIVLGGLLFQRHATLQPDMIKDDKSSLVDYRMIISVRVRTQTVLSSIDSLPF
jgi:hypothetical protein